MGEKVDVAVASVEGALDIDGELCRHLIMVHRVGEGQGLGYLLCGGEGELVGCHFSI